MTTGPVVEILGVRHHGPGSARSVRRMLDLLEPTEVIIEGPPELDAVVPLAASATMEPPVAGLVYDVKEPRRASFYPMAVFSPEWVALRWAAERGVTARFADLPAANHLAPPADGSKANEPDHQEPEPTAVPEPTDQPDLTEEDVADPLGALASAAGYDDAERWWEDAIEQRVPDDDVAARFAAVRHAMTEFRVTLDESPAGERGRTGVVTLRREAAMRKIIRSVVKSTSGPVAVVCGAFHAPVLHPDDWPTAASDNALVKGLAKTKVAATWAPWTSSRLAYASGYGAGVTAPGWYHHLFTEPDDVIARWMVRVARMLRDEGYDASAASVVEATRLADALAALRGRPLAGLAEVGDAATTILTNGSTLQMQVIGPALLVGNQLGRVPLETPMVPLAEDLARHQRSLRLKPSAETNTVKVDLRNPSQLARSVLFRRLSLLGIPWAAEVDTGRTGGTFKEAWQLEWVPELAVAVIEASLYGTTVVSAAAARVIADARDTPDLAALARLVEACLPADLPEALSEVLDIMAARTALQPDYKAMMGTVEPLARTSRYGDVRNVDTATVRTVLATMVGRAAIGLANACTSLDDDAAAEMRALVESVDRGVALVADAELLAIWRDALAALSTSTVHGAVVGRVTRLLLDAGRIPGDEAGRRLDRALSSAVGSSQVAAWLDGFLAGDVTLLLHDTVVFGLVDEWLTGLDDDIFDDVLPLVRRTFAHFETAERRQIGDLVSRGSTAESSPASGDDIDAERAAPAVAKVAELLGLALAPFPSEGAR